MKKILYLLIIVPFILWLFRYINLDFWYDEVYSLIFFILQPLKVPLTQYPCPNNHVFFSLVFNVYLKILNINELNEVLADPYKLRMLMFIFTIITIYIAYLTGKKFFSDFAGISSLIILVTTIPFYNAALQIRGYGFNIFLFFALIYFLWNLERSFNWHSWIMTMVLTTVTIYTIPSNLYVILSMLIFYFALMIFRKKDAGRYIIINLAIIVGVFLSVIFYLPIIKNVIHNEVVQVRKPFSFYSLKVLFPQVFVYFISGRYALMLIEIVGLIYLFIKWKRINLIYRQKTLFCLNMLIFPFILSGIRGDTPFDRTFIVTIPFFVILNAVLFVLLLITYESIWKKRWLIMLFFVLYNQIIFGYEIYRIRNKIRIDITNGQKSQDIYYNYYQECFHPKGLIRHFYEKIYLKNPLPVFLGETDHYSIRAYLDMYKINYDYDLAKLCEEKRNFYIITSNSKKYEEIFTRDLLKYNWGKLNQMIDFHDIYLFQAKK